MFTKLEKEMIRFCVATATKADEDRLLGEFVRPAHRKTMQVRVKVGNAIVAKLAETDEPITAEWLESVGAFLRSDGYYTIDLHSGFWLSICFEDENLASIKLACASCDYELPLPINRHFFAEQYGALRGERLWE